LKINETNNLYKGQDIIDIIKDKR